MNDTSLGGPLRSFPSTRWSQLGGPKGYDTLLRAYWKPAYVYIRTAWRKSNEEAKDLTQDFFTRLLQGDRLKDLRPDGGRFRAYLKEALRNYLIDVQRAAATRRDVEPAFRIDVDPDRWSPPAPGASPEAAFDREWLACLLDVATKKLEAELATRGKSKYFDVFRLYLLEGGDVTYGSVAKKLDLSESDVRNHLTHCRGRLKELLAEEIRDTVDDDGDAEAELRGLLG